MTLKIDCRSCRGTGLYCGFAERNGEAVICLTCRGKGWEQISVTPFETRKRKPGIITIRNSAGTTILSCGPRGKAMTYAEFEREIPS